MKFKKFAAVALSVALAAASMPISGLAAAGDAIKEWLWYEDLSMDLTSEGELLLGGKMELTATYTSSNASEASASDAVESASNAKIKWEITEGNIAVADGVVSAVKYDMNNAAANTATVTASLVEAPSVNATAKVEIAAPALKAAVDNAEITPDKTAKITPTLTNVANSVKESATYKFAVSDSNKIAVSDAGVVSTTQNATNGVASVTVTAYYATLPIAEATVNVTVGETTPTQNTLTWHPQGNRVTAVLYINSETAGDDTVSIPFTSSFDDKEFAVKVADPTIAEPELNQEKDPEDGLRYVKVKAVKSGRTQLTLSHIGVEDIYADIVVIDSSKPAETIVVKPDIIQADIEEWTEWLETAETPDGEILIETLPEEERGNAVAAFQNMLIELNESSALKLEEAVPTFPENIDEILLEKGLVKPGEKAAISVLSMIKFPGFAYQVEADGSYTYYLYKVVYDVEPIVDIYDEDGVFVTTRPIGDAFEDEKSEVSFILPIPDSSAKMFKYAKVSHEGDDAQWPNMAGEEGGKYVKVKATHFSLFEIEFTDTKDTGSSSNGGSGWVKPAGSSGGSGSSTNNNMNAKGGKSGQWQQNEKGWWFRYTDGTYPTNEWVELEWQNVKNWYFFDAEGYLATGWKQDGATWYYLHPIADGTQGHMYTGWKEIDGKWYYFSTVAGGPLGAMLSNTTTPDGYQVGADGAWIQ